MADIQSATAEIRRGKKEERRKKKPQDKNIMVCHIHRATIMRKIALKNENRYSSEETVRVILHGVI